jgi:hypothetical protein
MSMVLPTNNRSEYWTEFSTGAYAVTSQPRPSQGVFLLGLKLGYKAEKHRVSLEMEEG